MGVIKEAGENDDCGDDDEDDRNGDDDEDIRGIGQTGHGAQRLGGKGDQNWTRGPTQLQYEDREEDVRATELTSVVEEEEQETEMDQPEEETEQIPMADERENWTRGPTQLQYDDREEDVRETELTPVVEEEEQETEMDQPEEETEQIPMADEREQATEMDQLGEEEKEEGGEEEEEELEHEEEEEEELEHEKDEDEEEKEGAEEEDGDQGEGKEEPGRHSPLRLRGGAGPPPNNLKPPRPSRSATAPGSPRASTETANSQTGAKRPAPWSGTPAKRQAPRPPGGLRRSSSMPGGRFRPPRRSTVNPAAAVGTGTVTCHAEDSVSAEGAVGDSSGHVGSARSGSDTEGDEENSNKEERSQVVVPGWGSQGHHPVEYSESQLSFITTAELRTSPNLARVRCNGAGVEEVRMDEVGTSKRQKVRGEGDRVSAASSDVAGNAPIAPHAPAEGSGGDAVDSACAAPVRSPASCASDPPPLDGHFLEQESMLGVVSAKEDTSVAPPGNEMKLAPEPAQEIGGKHNAQHNAADADTGEAAVKSRWRGADARLHLAHVRGNSPTFCRQAQTRGKGGDVKKWEGFSAGASCSFAAVGREAGEDGGMQDTSSTRSDQPSIGTQQDVAMTSDVTPSGLDEREYSLETPRSRPRQSKETRSSPRAPSPSRQLVVTAPSPTAAVTPGFPSLTPASPPSLDFGRSPAFPLSAHSDQSDIPPLGQPSPALLNVASSGACSNDGLQCDLDGAPDNSSLNSRGRLTSRSGLMTGSPAVESLSSLTPPIPRPRGRPSATIVLYPCAEAPDPKASVAALSRLGVPQVGAPTYVCT